MKSTFKKALAAVSAAAVVATSAAVFTAVPAQAVNTPSIGQVLLQWMNCRAAIIW